MHPRAKRTANQTILCYKVEVDLNNMDARDLDSIAYYASSEDTLYLSKNVLLSSTKPALMQTMADAERYAEAAHLVFQKRKQGVYFVVRQAQLIGRSPKQSRKIREKIASDTAFVNARIVQKIMAPNQRPEL